MPGPTFWMDADIPSLIAGTGGVAVSINGVPGFTGLVDYVGKDVLQTLNIAAAQGTTITCTMQTSALPLPLLPNTPMVVDGMTFRVRETQPEGDGGLTHVLLERIP